MYRATGLCGVYPGLLGCWECIRRRWVAPIGNGRHVAFAVPARRRVKRVWKYWGALSGQRRLALAPAVLRVSGTLS